MEFEFNENFYVEWKWSEGKDTLKLWSGIKIMVGEYQSAHVCALSKVLYNSLGNFTKLCMIEREQRLSVGCLIDDDV